MSKWKATSIYLRSQNGNSGYRFRQKHKLHPNYRVKQGFFIRKRREITWIKERNFYWCWHWFCLQLSYWFYFQKDRIFPYGPGVCFPVVLQIIALAQSKSYFASSQTLQRFQEQSVQAVFLQRLLWLYFKTIPLVWTSHRSLHVFVYHTFKPC